MRINTSLIQDLKKLFSFSLLLFIPCLLLLLLGNFYIVDGYNLLREILAFLLQTCVFLVIISLVNKILLKKYLYYLILCLLTFLVFVKLSFYSLYNTKLSASAFFIIFETNSTEVVEFLLDFLTIKIISLFIILLLFLILSFRMIFLNTNIKTVFNGVNSLLFENKILKILVLGCFLTSIFVINRWFIQENIIYSSIVTYKEYQVTKSLFRETLSKRKSVNLKVNSSLKTPQTYVVIIGESTNRKHMQLYGYNRKTNPLLTEIKDELLVFKNTVSPHTHTITSLEKVLTLKSKEFTDDKKNASIVQLANQGGFKTYWLSNQRPIGVNETLPTQIANASDKKYFINSEDYIYAAHDEVLLPYLDEILLDRSAEKKVIFIHLMGTHGVYRRRYPLEFDVFKGVNPMTTFKHSKSEKLVNEYDNAVRYNDMIVRTVIEKVKKEQTRSYVVYFSDHGEELYDNVDSCGHNEYSATKSMYEVPFVLWLSDKYKQDRPSFIKDTLSMNRKYNLENFIYSLADLSQIQFDEENLSKSIFNENFITPIEFSGHKTKY